MSDLAVLPHDARPDDRNRYRDKRGAGPGTLIALQCELEWHLYQHAYGNTAHAPRPEETLRDHCLSWSFELLMG